MVGIMKWQYQNSTWYNSLRHQAFQYKLHTPCLCCILWRLGTVSLTCWQSIYQKLRVQPKIISLLFIWQMAFSLDVGIVASFLSAGVPEPLTLCIVAHRGHTLKTFWFYSRESQKEGKELGWWWFLWQRWRYVSGSDGNNREEKNGKNEEGRKTWDFSGDVWYFGKTWMWV
jgi:hypothetical protein